MNFIEILKLHVQTAKLAYKQRVPVIFQSKLALSDSKMNLSNQVPEDSVIEKLIFEQGTHWSISRGYLDNMGAGYV